MKEEDEQPTEEELREAAELAKALEGASDAPAADRPPPADALEAATLLRHARAPIAVPPALEPRVMAQVTEALEARRSRGRRRVRTWMAISLGAPAMVALFVSFTVLRSPSERSASLAPVVALPTPSADLLAAQAQATRGGGQASAALARLDVEMRAFRHSYHEGLRRRLGSQP